MQFCDYCSNEVVFSCSCSKPDILCLQHFNIHKSKIPGLHIPDLVFSSHSILAEIQLALSNLYKDVLTEAKGAMEVIRHKASQDLALIQSLQNICKTKYSEKQLIQMGSLKPFDDQIKQEGTFFSFHFEKFIESLKKIQAEINSKIRNQISNSRGHLLIDEANARTKLPNTLQNTNNRFLNPNPQFISSAANSELVNTLRNSGGNLNQGSINSGMRGIKDKIKIPQIKNDESFEKNHQYHRK